MEKQGRQKKNRKAVWLLRAGILGIVCSVAVIAVLLKISMEEEAYYASLPALFTSSVASDDYDYENYDGEYREDMAMAPEERTEAPDIDVTLVQKQWPAAAAWIRLDGTVLDYPVMYADNNDYYLTRLPDGKRGRSGSIFIDSRNKPDFSDQHTFIHGHRMRSGAMFGTLKYYVHQSFYDQHPTFSLFTPAKKYDVQLLAGYVFDQVKETPRIRFKDAAEFDRFVSAARRRSMFKSDVEVTYGDKLVSLATCEYSIKEGRLILVGKLVEKDG